MRTLLLWHGSLTAALLVLLVSLVALQWTVRRASQVLDALVRRVRPAALGPLAAGTPPVGAPS